MKREPFGGGRKRTVRLSKQNKLVEARIGLAGSPVGVITEGGLAGMLVHPYWGPAQVEGMASSHGYRLARDLYLALRKVGHMLSTYNESGVLNEKEAIYRSLDAAWELHDLLLDVRVATVDALETRIRSTARKIFEAVGNRPNDPIKRAIHDAAVTLNEVYDGRKRVNPTVKLTQLLAIRRRLYRRLMVVQAIEPNLHRWRESFLAMVDEAERLFGEVTAFLAPRIEMLSKLKPGSRLSIASRRRLTVRLGHYADELERLDINPFRRPCRRMANELRKGSEYFSAGRYHAAATVLQRTLESLKLRGVRTDLEKFINYLTVLMYHPCRTLSKRERGIIINGLMNIRERLGRVDEYRFVHPVCLQARENLRLAAAVFKVNADNPISGLWHFREALKVVAQPL